MENSQFYITQCTNKYLSSCMTLLEMLKAMQRVSQMTPADVAKMSDRFQKNYSKIKDSADEAFDYEAEILCIDDEPLMLKMLEKAIKKARPDADVTAHKKQSELLEDAEKNGCDIAFLDIHMYGMNGVELAKKLKELNPKMNIIFVTGFSEYKGDAMDMKASGYIMNPVTADDVRAELDDLRFPIVPKSDVLLRVQCFGNFEVFKPNGEIMKFDRSKSKEIFAYLVHRQGSSCSTKEIAAELFEDEPYDAKQQNYVQQLIYFMLQSLKNAGVGDVIVRSRNALAVNTKLLDCDYYRFKELDAGAVNSFQNEYMVQYYWADFLYDEDF